MGRWDGLRDKPLIRGRAVGKRYVGEAQGISIDKIDYMTIINIFFCVTGW